MRKLLRLLAGALAAASLSACGASNRGGPTAPYLGGGREPTPQQQAQYAQPTAMPPPPPAASPAGPSPVMPGHSDQQKKEEEAKLEAMPRTREQSIQDFVSSEKAIFLSAPDCATACRALRSMTRAAGRACEPPVPATTEVDCKEIGARVGRARTRVTEVCGVCPDGPP